MLIIDFPDSIMSVIVILFLPGFSSLLNKGLHFIPNANKGNLVKWKNMLYSFTLQFRYEIC